MARGAIHVAVSHTCGAGGHRCPSKFLHAFSRWMRSHPDGLPVATPDTVIMQSVGCGGALRAPYGKAAVTAATVRWHVDFVGSGPDCFGTVIGFIRFTQPVFDMHSRLRLIATNTSLGKHRRVTRGTLYPAPELSRWVHTGAGWHPQDCRRCPPGRQVRSG
jgi:hypothetical protein